MEEEVESNLPAEAVPVFRGAPRTKLVAVVDSPLTETNASGLQTYIDGQGNRHTETPRALRAFEDYLNDGSARSLRKLAERYAIEENDWTDNLESIHKQLQQYSRWFDWQNRIRLHIARESASALANAQKFAGTRKRARVQLAGQLQSWGQQILRTALQSTDKPLTVAEARELMRDGLQMVRIGMESEREEIGEAMEAIKPPKDPNNMTDEELDEYIDILRQNLG
jgi:hypothetical protein